MRRGVKSIEFFLAIIIAILLVGSLLSEKYLNLPHYLVSLLILSFIVVKIIDIVRAGGTIFEDYASLAIIFLFGIIHFFLGDEVNSIILVVIVFVLIYSVGMVPWVNDLLRSRKITSFILSYGFFLVMIIFLFAGAYFANNDDFTYFGEKRVISFEDSLYFSTISFTTVGYGDISPMGINKLIASIQAITGMILNLAFIGHILVSQRFRKR